MRIEVAIVVAAASIAGIHARSDVPSPLRFVEHVVATDLTGGYQVLAVDMNRDGRRDLLALGSGPGDLVWFENPTWDRHVIARGIAAMINADAFDIDGDGIPEVALASGFSSTPAKSPGVLSLLTRGRDAAAPWLVREVDRLATSHRLRWIDADGSGRRVLVNVPLAAADAAPPEYRRRTPVVYYRPGEWTRAIVTGDEEGVVHGTAVVDWDGSGREALLTAGFLGVHLHRYTDGVWQRTRLTPADPAPWPKSGASDVAVARVAGERLLATIEPWHGHQVATYSESAGVWQRTVIDDTLVDGHTLAAEDLDGDGSHELIAGHRGEGGRLAVYRRGEKGQWARLVVAEKSGPAAGCAVQDLNGDRRPDIACIGAARLAWYENQKR